MSFHMGFGDRIKLRLRSQRPSTKDEKLAGEKNLFVKTRNSQLRLTRIGTFLGRDGNDIRVI